MNAIFNFTNLIRHNIPMVNVKIPSVLWKNLFQTGRIYLPISLAHIAEIPFNSEIPRKHIEIKPILQRICVN